MARLFLLCLAMSLLASCQYGVREPSRPGWDQLGTSRLGGSVEVKAERIEEHRTGAGGEVDLNEMRFREELGLALSGFYYHPKLIDFDLKGDFGLEQRSIESSGFLAKNTVDGENLGYDLSARLFKDLPYSGELFAVRSETRTRQSFFETNEAVITDEGVRAFAHDWWLSSQLELRHHEYQGRGLNDYQEVRDTLRMEGRREADSLQLQYLAEYNDVQLGNFGDPFEDFTMNASGTKAFGEDGLSRFFSGMYYRRQWGSNDNRNLDWNNSLTLQLTDSLQSRSELQYSQTARDTDTTDTISGLTGLTHQLFQSLNSTIDLRLSTSKFGEGTIDTAGVRGGLTYTKRTPIGRLGVQQVLDTYTTDQGALQGISTTIGEDHVFHFGEPLFLNAFAIDAQTIVVRDASGLTVYRRGVDYFVIEVGSRIRIDIPVSSLISDGDTLLFDYDFQPTPEQKVNTLTSTTVVSLSVPEKADFSLGRTAVGQDLLSGFDDGTLEDSTRTFADARYYPTEDTTLGADFEDYTSNISPYTRWGAQLNQRLPVWDDIEWQASANSYLITFPDDDRSENGQSANTSLIGYFGSTMQASFTAEVHRAKLRTDTGDGYLLEFDVRRYFGRTLAAFNARLVDETFEIADDQRLLNFTLTFTRYF